MVKTHLKMWAVFVSFFIIVFVVNNKYTNRFTETLASVSIETNGSSNELIKTIEKEAPKYEVAPKDAHIDSVWKAIPGYNGLKVDIKASYNKMKDSGKFNKDKLVFKQVPPKVHLSDLPPTPVYRGVSDKKMVAFTINVAWGNEYLPKMLEVLKKHHAGATFFLEGRWVKDNPTLAQLIKHANQEIGNHSYSHPDMANLTTQAINLQLIKTNSIIEATTKEKVKWFAPPSGSYRDDVIKEAARLGLGTIMWTADTIDWQRPSREILINRVMKKLENGTIVLMHPTSPTSDSLDELLTKIEKTGRKVVNISTLLSENRE
ncbi:polysaccharide deacetylase family protein [Bacillus sp. RG28]|uniref:Polysaccharide deacetylase family protein n=1 Tax=Gottfriedia endophytica TaxID=2820819 RepID=A0A940NWE5_9BACI|nr:polysaccharide deacetylase family protein [Gottfriedia endophytica]MBP0726193.1 polysaccharide deacetylase family protein [Gottfriedia endophytica]